MADQPSTVRVIDQSQVAPPPGSVSTTTIPLTFFDMGWLFCCPVQRILFYEFSCPTLHFTQTVLPELKESLSLTLRHFYPFAANLTCPPPPYEPYILYNEGDSVQVTVVESDADFNHLVGNHARDVKTFKSLVLELPSTRLSSDTTHVVPTMAIQFTVFPNSGISVGLTYNHVAGDGRSFSHFLKFWASVHRSKAEDLTSISLPYHNKDIVKDPNGLSSIYLKDSRSNWKDISAAKDSSNNLLVSITMGREKIEQLKHWLATRSKNDYELAEIRITTFVVTSAFMWVNLLKLQEKISGSVDDDALCYFISVADCRERFDLSIPGTYFGNCLMYFLASSKRRKLIEESGMAVAVKVIGREMGKLGKGAVVGAEKWFSDSEKAIKSGRLVSVAGSPKFRMYETDFGWGRPKKSEVVHIGAYGAFSMHENREEEGGVEIGLIVERDKLDLFNAVFEQSLDIH